jgi:hypothetical protein
MLTTAAEETKVALKEMSVLQDQHLPDIFTIVRTAARSMHISMQKQG